jgi:hypothetical protein
MGGLIKPIRLPSGQRRYPVEGINRILGTGGIKATPDAVIIYARVSTKKQADAGNLVTSFSARLYGARGGKEVRQGFRELIAGVEHYECAKRSLAVLAGESPD